jgi:SpoVK/Ycf46/Vps4 family AAA+-type ATPase
MATGFDDSQLTALGVRRLNPDTDPQDLVLPEESEQRLRRIAGWLTQPPPVLREWGLHRFLDGGLRALFRGASGTGKTMAAIVIARWADRALLHVDLDREGDLDRIRAEAEESKAILLFDCGEADVGGLLRRIEPYEGLAILATDQSGDLGEDAMTRLDGIVDFPMPDAAARERLWRQTLGAMKMFKTDTVDAGALAKGYELPGADIVRAARIAALLAASDDQPLDMELLQHCAEERVKMREIRAE